MTAAAPALARAKAHLEQGRAEILARHRDGAGGQEVVRAISALTDEVVGDLFEGIGGEGELPLALVATGGYGRRELAPRSDVDLLALLPDEKHPHRAARRAAARGRRAALQGPRARHR